MEAETLPPRPVQLTSKVGQERSHEEVRKRTDVLAKLELRVLFAGQNTESVGTEVVALMGYVSSVGHVEGKYVPGPAEG